jgi:NADPH:quinone reductase-like Zn-dependent oxidoreductase
MLVCRRHRSDRSTMIDLIKELRLAHGATHRGTHPVPDELTSAEAASLLCAGITTYNALRNALG